VWNFVLWCVLLRHREAFIEHDGSAPAPIAHAAAESPHSDLTFMNGAASRWPFSYSQRRAGRSCPETGMPPGQALDRAPAVGFQQMKPKPPASVGGTPGRISMRLRVLAEERIASRIGLWMHRDSGPIRLMTCRVFERLSSRRVLPRAHAFWMF